MRVKRSTKNFRIIQNVSHLLQNRRSLLKRTLAKQGPEHHFCVNVVENPFKCVWLSRIDV